MEFSLPKIGAPALEMPHFPSKCMAFIFRAYEYIKPEKIAALLKTSVENVRRAAEEMGLDTPCTDERWMSRGYITIIRRMWHILPYEQLLELVEMDEQTLAVTLREDDFLDIKLGDKPQCDPVRWKEPTQEQHERMQKIGALIRSMPSGGAEAFDFTYEVQPIEFSGKRIFKECIIYPFTGLYQYAFDVDSCVYLPDEVLAAYSKTGVTGIWLQGVLFQLTEFPFAPEISKGHEKRLQRLTELTERCAKFGLKVFLYINEPRTMEDSFFEKYPHLRGHTAKPGKVCLCTSTKEIQDYLTDSIRKICLAAPKIGGFITISRSENPTNCYSHSTRENCQCPRCSKRSEAEVVAENINCIEAGAYSVSPDIKVFAWDWSWDQFHLEIIQHLNPRVVVQTKAEDGIEYEIGGVKAVVDEYSLSYVGPSDYAKKQWAAAKARGMETSAKVQVNTTWESSTVPALPVYPQIEKQMSQLKELGVNYLMLSWTLGGYPSRNIQHAAKYFYEESRIPELSPAQKDATEFFAQAIQKFPFSVGSLYFGPQNAGPSTLLYEKSTGYRATMTCYSYDEWTRWKSIFPADVYENQYAQLCELWKKGLALLENEPMDETKIMATAGYCLFRSSLNLFRFCRARDAGDRETMVKLARDEIESATQMLEMMNLNPAIGYEAANHYYYSKGCLREKVVNCHYVLSKLRAKK
jgi:hypothetical protein